MMVLSSLRPESSLVEFLESQARRESIRDLAFRTAAAVVVAMLAVMGPISTGKSILITAAIAYFSYAMWGLVDRARSRSIAAGRGASAQYLRILCAIIAGVGVVSGIGLLMEIGFTLLGSPWVL